MPYHARSATVRILLVGSIATLLGVVSLEACGNVTSPFDFSHLTSISISGDSVVQVGDTIRLSASGKDEAIIWVTPDDRVLDARWTVSNPAVASLTPVILAPGDTTSGSAVLLRGLRTGTVQVTAAARGVSGERSVTVIQHATP